MPVSQASWLPWQYPCPEVVLGRRHRLKCVSSCKTSVEIRLSMSVNMLFCPQCLHQKQSHVLLMNGLMNDLLCNSLFRSLNLCKRNVSVQQRTHCLHLRSAFVCGNVLDWIPIVCYKKKKKNLIGHEVLLNLLNVGVKTATLAIVSLIMSNAHTVACAWGSMSPAPLSLLLAVLAVPIFLTTGATSRKVSKSV